MRPSPIVARQVSSRISGVSRHESWSGCKASGSWTSTERAMAAVGRPGRTNVTSGVVTERYWAPRWPSPHHLEALVPSFDGQFEERRGPDQPGRAGQVSRMCPLTWCAGEPRCQVAVPVLQAEGQLLLVTSVHPADKSKPATREVSSGDATEEFAGGWADTRAPGHRRRLDHESGATRRLPGAIACAARRN